MRLRAVLVASALGSCCLARQGVLNSNTHICRPSSFLRPPPPLHACRRMTHAHTRSPTALAVATQGPPQPTEGVPPLVEDVNKATVQLIKDCLRAVYGDRHYAYFHALETVARVPYFAYTSVLHLYETLGWSRRSDLMKIHFAESWNEQHHLLIMEALGGSTQWRDRFIAQHMAVAYFFIASLLYITYPAMAYNLSEHVERHAYSTYDKFLAEHEEELKQQPAPEVAKEYYQTGDLYMFDEFHTSRPSERRRPSIGSLYDVFREVRDDEREHFMTMEACQKEADAIVSPNTLPFLKKGKRPPQDQGGSAGPETRLAQSERED